MVRFLADENVAGSVVELLNSKGHEVEDVREGGLAGAPDEAIVDVARAEDRVILTHDRDFAGVLTQPLDPPVGVVLIRCADQRPDNVRTVLDRLLASPVADRLQGNLVVVSEDRIVLHTRR